MEVEDTVIVPLLKHRKLVDKGIELRMGNILFHGPPGCGKTTLAHAIANESSLPLYKLSPSDIGNVMYLTTATTTTLSKLIYNLF